MARCFRPPTPDQISPKPFCLNRSPLYNPPPSTLYSRPMSMSMFQTTTTTHPGFAAPPPAFFARPLPQLIPTPKSFILPHALSLLGTSLTPKDEEIGAYVNPSERLTYPWHAINTAPNREFAVADQISSLSLPVYCPRFPATWVNRGRRYTATLPYLRSWVFARWDATDAHLWHRLKSITALRSFLGGPNPAPIPETDMVLLRARLAERPWELVPNPTHTLTAGTPITFIDGPWVTHRGVVTSARPHTPKIWVKIFGLLGRDIEVPCSASWCEPLPRT